VLAGTPLGNPDLVAPVRLALGHAARLPASSLWEQVPSGVRGQVPGPERCGPGTCPAGQPASAAPAATGTFSAVAGSGSAT
jgi:hypothetical protein